MLQLRPYQERAIEALRDGFARGFKSQVLYAPTGAGKTEMAIALLDATKRKLNSCGMIMDRIILCEQTSQRLEKYQIDHGVLMSGHWRYRPYEKIQICSAQTLEKREMFPDFSLAVIDECHTVREKIAEYIRNNPQMRVVGLSATPFTKGMALTYDNIISTVTTQQLMDQGVLVPLKIYVAKEIDMSGAKKVAGEWSQAEATERGLKITGDIVAEWIKKTHEIFGKPEKTIVFCSGVAHGMELSKKFAEHGYKFVSVSYHDTTEDKQEVIREFSKPDSDIHGLVATDVLTKGFDVPDVKIGVSARPFSKSLSSHIQQMGRVMRGHPTKQFAVWLDHSGNYLRFLEDWEDIKHHGVKDLDDGKEKPKKEKTEKEKTESKCPKCGYFWKGLSVCPSCGCTRERKSLVESVPGEMEELGAFKFEDKQKFWSELQFHKKYRGWSDKRCLATYRERFGAWPKGLNDTVSTPSPETEAYIYKRTQAYIRKMKRR
ncbi:MAG: helicase [Proteobacteria bacterium]|nr:helicase [Pseudomonadota bacterium]